MKCVFCGGRLEEKLVSAGHLGKASSRELDFGKN